MSNQTQPQGLAEFIRKASSGKLIDSLERQANYLRASLGGTRMVACKGAVGSAAPSFKIFEVSWNNEWRGPVYE